MQSGKPAASAGFVVELDVEPLAVELVLLVLGLVLLPELGLELSLRTCFVRGSQHLIVLVEVAPGLVVVLGV